MDGFMKTLGLIGWLALASACSSYGVRCDKHLRPINMPAKATVSTTPKARGSTAGHAATGKP